MALINVPTAFKSRVHCALYDDGGSLEDEPMGLLQLSRQLLLSHAGVQEQEGGIDVGAVALLGEDLPLLVS